MTRVCLLVLLCGCWRGGDSTTTTPAPIENTQPAHSAPRAPARTEAEAALDKMETFQRNMCACPAGDSGCAQQVSDEMSKWAQEMSKSNREPAKMTEADQQRATEIGTRMGECMQKAMTPPQP